MMMMMMVVAVDALLSCGHFLLVKVGVKVQCSAQWQQWMSPSVVC